MVVNDKDHIDVYLNLLPLKRSCTVAKSVNCPQGKPLKKAGAPEMEHFRGFSTYIDIKMLPMINVFLPLTASYTR